MSMIVAPLFLQARAERPHHIGDGSVHVVHAVGIHPRAPERIGRPRRVAPFQRVQRLNQGVPRDVLRPPAARLQLLFVSVIHVPEGLVCPVCLPATVS